MKVILYLAITANGFIANKNDETPWSDEEWESYHDIVKKIGNIIIGRKTYEIMSDGNEFSKIGNPVTVVLTSNDHLNKGDSFHFVNTPQEALKKLENLGFDETIIGGGEHVNSSFMKEGLIDEIYLDVEPVIFGKGISLFTPQDFEYNLQMLGLKKLNNNTIQLHYKVVK